MLFDNIRGSRTVRRSALSCLPSNGKESAVITMSIYPWLAMERGGVNAPHSGLYALRLPVPSTTTAAWGVPDRPLQNYEQKEAKEPVMGGTWWREVDSWGKRLT